MPSDVKRVPGAALEADASLVCLGLACSDHEVPVSALELTLVLECTARAAPSNIAALASIPSLRGDEIDAVARLTRRGA